MNKLIMLLLIIIFTFACGSQPSAQDWEIQDENPVVYQNPDDNIEIEIEFDFDGDGRKEKQKVKRGDYNTGRYKLFKKVRTLKPALNDLQKRSSRTPQPVEKPKIQSPSPPLIKSTPKPAATTKKR